MTERGFTPENVSYDEFSKFLSVVVLAYVLCSRWAAACSRSPSTPVYTPLVPARAGFSVFHLCIPILPPLPISTSTPAPRLVLPILSSGCGGL